MSEVNWVALRRRFRPRVQARLKVKTPEVTATGILVELNKLVVKTPSVTATGVKLATSLLVKTPEVTATAVKLTTRLIVKTPEVTVTGVRLATAILIKTPLVTATGVKAYPFSGVIAKTPLVTATAVHVNAYSPLLFVKTPEVTVTGVHVNAFNVPTGEGSIGDLQLFYSGGDPAPTDYDEHRQYYSLGGVIATDSTSLVHSQTFTTATITGVTIKEAYSNPIAGATLYFISGSLNQYQWGATAPVDIPGAGLYTLGNSEDGQIYVDCDGTFPGGDTDEVITIGRDRHKMFDLLSPLDIFFGDSFYRCFYVKNTSSDFVTGVRVWVDRQPPVGTTYEIGLDPVGSGDGTTTGVAVTIPREKEAPVGVTFSAPEIDSALVIGNLLPGYSAPVWVKRTATETVNDIVFFNTADIGIGALL